MAKRLNQREAASVSEPRKATARRTAGGAAERAWQGAGEPSDEALIERVLGGDAESFEVLVKRHYQRIF